ncbi:MAG TPA: class I tRNA ligase family protein [Candidatus Paceibacterota bacterium]|jgi:isoleucyl-tRNA synthetase|nr:class I tRNA ligase family protein [Candidatus Paceibacterota bacterium]
MEQENTKSNRAQTEERILEFWKENQVFEKTVAKDAPKGDYIFYEGPPTANAKPALHHLEARAFKDVIPRYKTMQGYHVPRRAGWDTHGLPVELQIEKKLGLNSKKEIESYGVAAFNKECKDSVFTYIKDWEKFTERIGYWVDKKSAYYTFDANYMESLWHILSTVNNKGLVYKDFKVLPWCPRCGTALSSHELAQPGAYFDVKDLSVYAKFRLKNKLKFEDGNEYTGYIVAWTTTPWTLPGNVALAVGKDIKYVFLEKDKEVFIVADERKEVFGEEYRELTSFLGEELLGLEYEPLYPYLSEIISGPEQEKMKNAYKVYAADFVTTTDGTGIVHTAVMYGADDFDLGTKVGLPKFHTVDDTGHFIKGTDFLEGRFVKDEEVAVDIIKDLAHRGLLFKKEKYEHSYPHCWRCKTPLLYYARDSWYIAMSKLRDQLVHENESINWEPSHIKHGRFGEWLKDAKDWAISRERYWGTPLPIWQAPDGERLFIGSIAELKEHAKRSGNTYFVMRHGQTEHNIKGLWNFGDRTDPLTEEGQKQVSEGAKMLKDKNIDVIIASPFKRALETATIVATELGLNQETIISDERIGEWNAGKEFDDKPLDDYFEVRNAHEDRYGFKTADGESYVDIIKRAGQFIYDIEQKYQGKNVLIISHGAVTRAIELISNGISMKTLFEKTRQYKNFANGEVRHIDFVPLPHNEGFELDLHRPYIDDVVLVKEGQEYRRVKEVMDVWFDSGSMPFAQDHYPFENKEWIDTKGFPADFISEAIDQTRGWFYTLHNIGILMGRGKAYKNVICLGHILDAEGKKMSKSIGNIVDPEIEISRFGVDTLRLWMYSVNQPGDSKNYDPKTVAELERQVFGLLYNILSFYELYRDLTLEVLSHEGSKHVLDQWIIARLHLLISICTGSLDEYKLMEPVRAIRDFINDLSTWWLRRSRDRLKDGDSEAKTTLYHVLKTVAQLLAPFAPFASEDIWLQLKTNADAESVHLSPWPTVVETYFDEVILLEQMIETRSICTIGNALRKRLAIPVRQPLQSITVRGKNLPKEYCELIMDELNVKAVAFDEELTEEAVLDVNITPELKAEGDYREFVRAVQDLRKKQDLTPSDVITIAIDPELELLLTPFLEDFKKTVLATSVTFANNDGEVVTVADKEVKVHVSK